MRRATAIQEELIQVETVEGLATVFESIASLKIAKVRNRVVASKEFFAELWQTYRGLRVDSRERLSKRDHNDKTILVAVTAESKLGGDIDEQVVKQVIEAVGAQKDVEVIAVGGHGASLLSQAGIQPSQVFHIPEGDLQFGVSDIIQAVEKYKQISVFYQTYVSLRVQKVAHIELVSVVEGLSEEVSGAEGAEAPTDIVSTHDYIFEPDSNEITDYLESLMLGVALTQVIMESRLAQYASRFNAMHAAKNRAGDLGKEFSRLYHHAKRGEADERTKEVMKVMQVMREME